MTDDNRSTTATDAHPPGPEPPPVGVVAWRQRATGLPTQTELREAIRSYAWEYGRRDRTATAIVAAEIDAMLAAVYLRLGGAR